MITFVYPFWQGGASYDELRWSIRSIYKNFVPPEGESFEVVIVGDQPILKRTSETWYSGKLIECPRIVSSEAFRNKLRDALNKWSTAIHSDQVADTIVWMMDDIYFIKPVTIEELCQPRAKKPKTESELNDWNPKNGFSKTKKETLSVLLSEKLPTYDFATHLPHVANKESAKAIFSRYNLKRFPMLWEILYENVHLGDRQPLPKCPFLYYFRGPHNDEALKTAFQSSSVIVNGASAWNEALRRWLWKEFPDPSPVECLPALPPKQKRVKQSNKR